MKKTTILAAIFILCGQVLAAEMPLHETSLTRHQYLSSEPLKTQNHEETIQSLTQQLEQERFFSKYLLETNEKIGTFTTGCVFFGLAAVFYKLVYSIQDYDICKNITEQGALCTFSCPAHPLLNLYNIIKIMNLVASNFTGSLKYDVLSYPSACVHQSLADACAYLGVVGIIGVFCYSYYKLSNAPARHKYKTS